MRKAKQIGFWDLIWVSLSITLGTESLASTVGAEPFHLYSQQETLRESQAQKGSQRAPRICLYLFEREKWIWEMKLINSGFRPWCWERLRAGGEGDDRGWDGWMASPTWWTWVWVDSGSWWWTGRPGVLQFMRSQRVGHDWATELNWMYISQCYSLHPPSPPTESKSLGTPTGVSFASFFFFGCTAWHAGS